jgi:hypothetical protein
MAGEAAALLPEAPQLRVQARCAHAERGQPMVEAGAARALVELGVTPPRREHTAFDGWWRWGASQPSHEPAAAHNTPPRAHAHAPTEA